MAQPTMEIGLAERAASRWNWRLLAVIGLSIAGMAVSGYLAYIHYSSTATLFCGEGGGCETVNSSKYADIGGVPLALFGGGMYGALLALAWLATQGRGGNLPAIGIFVLSLTGVAYSAWLTYVEIYVIRAICPWCVTSAAIVTFIFVLSLAELWHTTGAEEQY